MVCFNPPSLSRLLHCFGNGDGFILTNFHTPFGQCFPGEMAGIKWAAQVQTNNSYHLHSPYCVPGTVKLSSPLILILKYS